MPLGKELSALMEAEIVVNNRESQRLTGVVDRSLTQGLGVIQNILIQQHGGTADDAATMAALRTAIHIPQVDAG